VIGIDAINGVQQLRILGGVLVTSWAYIIGLPNCFNTYRSHVAVWYPREEERLSLRKTRDKRNKVVKELESQEKYGLQVDYHKMQEGRDQLDENRN
jgi:hypothetical protein